MSTAMTSLALVKIFADSNKSYLDNFVPFLAECLRKSDQDIVVVPDVQQMIRRQFRLEIPQHALRLILARAKNKGYIRKKHGAYYRVMESLKRIDFSRIQEDLITKYNRLIGSFCSFACDKYGFKLSVQEAEDTLLSYLDDYSIEIVNSAVREQLPTIKGKKLKSKRYILSVYILHCYETKQPEFEYVDLAARGMMLANAVFLPHPDQ